MSPVKEWVVGAFQKYVDPRREQKINEAVSVVKKGLQTKGKAFSINQVAQEQKLSQSDLTEVKDRVYRSLLHKSWEDQKLTAQEKAIADWVGQSLDLSQSELVQINEEYAQSEFARLLASAMEDGRIDPKEDARLRHIAETVGYTVSEFCRRFFRKEGESFIRGIFNAFVQDDELTEQEWANLLTTTEQLGLSKAELLAAIQSQAKTFVEHVLADAKADDELSSEEDSKLTWLMEEFHLPDDFRRYVKKETRLLKDLMKVNDGQLPSLNSFGNVQTKAGEIVHFHARAVWHQIRMLKSGERIDEADGTVTITDNRLIFTSSIKSHTINYRKIVSHQGTQKALKVQVEGKPMQTYSLKTMSRLAYPILSTAIAMANQTRVAKTEGSPSRHIPRNVRQRVWQRYGGRCVECGASDYLEFDHVIPIAKGGSNSESNVQLLCRRCNLKKSDNI